MRAASNICMALVIFAGGLPAFPDAVRKNHMATGEALREVGDVAAFQNFPDDFRLDRMGTLEADGEYFHIFICNLKELKRWRTLVFSNSGDYLGYYQNFDPPVQLEKNGLVFPGADHSAEFGDFENVELDSGDAHVIRFSAFGPPDEVKFSNKTYTFVSSPKRIRPEDPAYQFAKQADRIANALNSSRYHLVRDDFSPEARQRISEEKNEEILSGLRDAFGRIERVGAPWVQSDNTAVLPITFERTVAGLKLTLTDEGKILGMWVLPFKTAFPELGENRTPLSLPFRGRWRLLWGGRTREQSKYFGNRACHHALEFVISSRFGKTWKGEGKKNIHFFAFGQPVFAPADGKVVAVVNDVEDNDPYSPNPFDRLGNTVMIQHATNEYSVIGHMMQDSIVVSVGATVKTGQVIGRCGNSGDSSQPSIYFHVQDSLNILAGSGYLPVFSNLYLWNRGETEIVEQYSPVRGEFIQQRTVPQKAASPGEGSESEAFGE